MGRPSVASTSGGTAPLLSGLSRPTDRQARYCLSLDIVLQGNWSCFAPSGACSAVQDWLQVRLSGWLAQFFSRAGCLALFFFFNEDCVCAQRSVCIKLPSSGRSRPELPHVVILCQENCIVSDDCVCIKECVYTACVPAWLGHVCLQQLHQRAYCPYLSRWRLVRRLWPAFSSSSIRERRRRWLCPAAERQVEP
jgi:hypothetical protein